MRRFIWITLIGILLAPAAARAQDEVVYFHTDAIGSVRVVTDATGVVIARYDYLPFGEPWNPPQNPDSRRFAGKELDAETGLDYFGARYYRAQSGRFTSVDPVLSVESALADPQRWNRYSYAVNRPLTMIDPDGREAGYIYLRSGGMLSPYDRGFPRSEHPIRDTVGLAAAFVIPFSIRQLFTAGTTCVLSPACQSSAVELVEGAAGGAPRTIAAGNRANVATVEELVTMMNKRVGVKAEFATGDAAAYLERMAAEGAHMMLEGGKSNILLRADVATRRTALHEWLHRVLQKRNGGPTPGEDRLIEDFLNRHKKLFRLDHQQ